MAAMGVSAVMHYSRMPCKVTREAHSPDLQTTKRAVTWSLVKCIARCPAATTIAAVLFTLLEKYLLNLYLRSTVVTQVL